MKLIANLSLLREAEIALREVAERHGLEVACEWDEEEEFWKIRFWEQDRPAGTTKPLGER